MSSNQNKKSKRKCCKPSAKALEGAFCCTPAVLNNEASISAAKSDGNIKHQELGLKQKFVNKVKSWSSKDKLIRNESATSSLKADPDVTTLSSRLENLQLSRNNSEEKMFQTKIFHARDSLESISISKSKFSVNDDSKLSLTKEIDVALSECTFNTSKTKTDSAKLTWDPWNKRGRENKRRKEKSPHTSRERTVDNLKIKKPKGCIAGDELHIPSFDMKRIDGRACEDTYVYHPHNNPPKCVTFVNHVDVIYFANDEILRKVSEPLKKESDQQIRNKEMRKGHVPCTLFGKRQSASENYMSAWFRK
ncbi:hypothetical protein PPYR_10328 [Photinus pyralis]|uniref:Uncharacterized protein n=2 Tax=Photinus pyralis TaxID=7054 RepID=A0A5N4AG18_PHOPY|nr:uncharacterized protein LOC116173724 isoform X1 [Photinus pyralis]KAB0796267.1 hypothetical protein PPYR_10328 [Photinus pyralis]